MVDAMDQPDTPITIGNASRSGATRDASRPGAIRAKRPRAADSAPVRAQPEKARGGEARRIADLMPAVGEQAFRRFGFIQSALVTRWPEIVGQRIAAATQPESLRFVRGTKIGGTLRLAVMGASAPLIQHALPDIITRVNRFFGYAAVGRVQLLQGAAARRTLPVIDRGPARVTAAPDRKSSAAAPNISIRAVEDPELRAVLEGLAQTLALRDGPPKIG